MIGVNFPKKANSKFTCECGKICRVRGSVFYKGIRYCKMCYLRKTKKIGGFKRHVLDNDKIRNVVSHIQKKNNIEYGCCVLNLPSCYSGKKVKVVVVEDI
jgi:hypothetical protein